MLRGTLGAEPANVVLELGALKNVAVSTAALAGSASNSSIETTSSKLGLEHRVNLSILLPLIQVALRVLGQFFGFSRGVSSGLGTLLSYRLGVLQEGSVDRS